MTNPKNIDPGDCHSVSLNISDEIHASIPIKFDKASTNSDSENLLSLLTQIVMMLKFWLLTNT